MRVLVLANESIFADAIVSTLTKESDLQVIRISHREPNRAAQAICEDHSLVIIVEDGMEDTASLKAGDLLETCNPLRILTISPGRHHLHFCESYQMPVTGLDEMLTLIRNSAERMED